MTEAAIPAAQDFGPAFALIAIATDPAAHAARLQELAEKSAEARALLEQAAAANADLEAKQAATEKALKQARADHDQAIASDRANFDAACKRRDDDLTRREDEVAELKAKAEAEGAANARLKADLENRITAVRELVRTATATTA